MSTHMLKRNGSDESIYFYLIINVIIEYIISIWWFFVSIGFTKVGMELTVKMNKIWSVLNMWYFNLTPVSNAPME